MGWIRMAAAVAACTFAFGLSQGEDLGSWDAKLRSSMPGARCEGGSAMVGDYAYAACGFKDNHQPSNDLYVYDFKNDKWSVKTSAPVSIHHMSFINVNGKLYLVGGCTGQQIGGRWVGTKTLKVYDPNADKWSDLKSAMPYAECAASVAAYNNKIYVFGGADDGANDHPYTQVYDPAADAWSQETPMTSLREHGYGVVLGSKIYVVGGRKNTDEGHPFATVEAYDPATKKWETKADMPHVDSDLRVVAINGKLYAMGGEKPAGPYDYNMEYDPNTNQWRNVAPLPKPNRCFLIHAYNGQIYTLGGDYGYFTSDVRVFTPPAPPVSDFMPMRFESHPPLRLGIQPTENVSLLLGRRLSASGQVCLRLPAKRPGEIGIAE